MSNELGKFDFPENFWKKMKSLLPKHKIIEGNGGRPRMDDRVALAGLLYSIKTGIAWRDMPHMFGTKSTIHRRFQ